MSIQTEIAQRIDKALDGDCGYGVGGYLADQIAPLIAKRDARVRAETLRKAREAINTVRNVPSLITLADKFGGYRQGQRSGLEMAEGIIARIEREAGAVWASEQADRGCGHPNHGAEDHDCAPFLPDREPSERLMVAPAIQAVRDVLDGLEDWEIQDRALDEIRSAVDDIPDCESATAIPHEEHGEPSDAEVEAAADAIVEASFGQELPEAPIDLARAAIIAAQGVRRADAS